MLHIATVHYRSPRWIEIQLRYLRQYISIPFRTWTSLEGIDLSYAEHFDHVIDQTGAHPFKLNHLALEISHVAEPDDLIMFLDGDAFPITDPMPLVEEALSKARLIAVRRAENHDDKQPHPAFCVTTVQAWHDLHGDWCGGYKWPLDDGRKATDVGANLLRSLELSGTPWVDIVRSNFDPESGRDRLFAAIYGDTIYHHGAGFRKGGASRGAYDTRPKPLPNLALPLLGKVTRQLDRARLSYWRLRVRAPQILESQRLYERIQAGDREWLAEIR